VDNFLLGVFGDKILINWVFIEEKSGFPWECEAMCLPKRVEKWILIRSYAKAVLWIITCYKAGKKS